MFGRGSVLFPAGRACSGGSMAVKHPAVTMAEELFEADDDGETGDVPEPAGSAEEVPRVWSVFTVVVLAFGAAIAVQIVAVLALLGRHVVGGMDMRQAGEALLAELTSPGVFIPLGLVSQLVLGLGAVVPAVLSAEPTARRLGLVRPKLPVWGYPIIAVGALLPLAVGVALVHLIALVIPPDPSVAKLYEQMTAGWAVPFLLFISLAPGLMEELLFRGYLQRRLLERWRPGTAILVTAVIFGVFHVTPHAAANAFVIGLWLGVLAWRTGSIWPGVLCHAFINGAWNVWQVGSRLWGIPETPPVWLAVCGGALIVVSFVLSVGIVWRRES